VVLEDKMLRLLVPLADHPEAVELHTESLYSTFVECEIEESRFRVRRSLKGKHFQFGGLHYGDHILDKMGEVIGRTSGYHLHEDGEGYYDFMRVDAVNFDPEDAERSRIPLDVARLWDHLHRDCGDRYYEDISMCIARQHWGLRMYLILCVEFEDGIAYRKNVGFILRDAWDAAETENVNVRLG
jgi:hypothetical protein